MKEKSDAKLLKYYLDKSDFVSHFDRNISSITKLFYFKEGEYLITEGQVPENLYFMVDGECRFFSLSSSGSLVAYGGSKKYRLLGEVASLWNLEPTSSVQAVKDTYCLGINLNKYREVLLDDNKFLRFVGQILATSITRLDDIITAHTISKVKNRLAAFILQNETKDIFQVTIITTSEAVGASYHQVQRAMTSFCAQNILHKDKRKYRILNRSKLENLASDSYGYFD